MKRIVVVLLISAAFAFICNAASRGYSYGNNNSEELRSRLPKKVYRALTAEMNALQNAMTNLAIAIPAGRLSEISETGRKMKEGYIMNNVLSKEQMAGFKSSHRLTESCVHCHLKYARQRFPDLGILKDDKQQQQ
jgi:hypothetical protein